MPQVGRIPEASVERGSTNETDQAEAAGVAQLVEHQPSKLNVGGSSPLARFAAS